MKRKAFIGDIHGCIDELLRLYLMLSKYGLDEIWHLGDMVDRGPNSGKVVEFCRTKLTGGVMGNHESVLLHHLLKGSIPQNPDKARSCESIRSLPTAAIEIDYIKKLPPLHVHDDKLLQVHAGISPYKNFYNQGFLTYNASLIHPDHPDKSEWMQMSREGRPEADLRAEGWKRWPEVYDLPYDVVCGHHVVGQVYKQNGEWVKNGISKAECTIAANGQKVYWLDTGCVWSKNLTAMIWPDLVFVSTKLGEYTL